MMGTCKGWFAAIEASPDLWPVFTVKLRSGIVGEQLSQLASLGSAVWHVRLQDHLMLSGSEPLLAPAVLLSLPRAVRVLEIGIPCGGPALEALLHCEQLRKLTITGLWDDNLGALCLSLPALRSLSRLI
ncbi:hypothetical protein C2E21_2506 [Chlorella sorokiniana]|uniref:Uncharacterized protein n=1 Tax=Chlorella sorokiniana TaxID=3076 RepID=A0A2P6TZ41_CHLSO|nr:hypothetical protein C2E21_2506 [Chlorella sorokiniana]|eukprot:PRW59331.1 hypothetical protein C2E21_2506 [Chlorella sorokiniana]